MTDPVSKPSPSAGTDPAGYPVGPSGGTSTPISGDVARAEPVASAQPSAQPQPAPGFNAKGKVSRTRVGGVWIGLIATAIFLIVLIVFIAQNSHQATIHFLGWHGRFSIGLAVLLSAVIGILLVAIPGSVRIFQLRRALRKNAPGGTVR